MRSHATAAVLSGAGLAAAAAAQTPSFIYSINVDPPLSQTPGVTATITILCAFNPGVGGLVNTPIGPRPVLGLSSGAFNIVGVGGDWFGPQLVPPYNALGTSPGLAAGASVTGVIWGNGFGPPLGVVSTANPTPVWRATFTKGPSNAALTVIPIGIHGVWAGNPGEFAVESLSQMTTGAQWVSKPPAPAGVSVLMLAGLLASRRRR